MTGLNPLDWQAPEFLILYVALFVAAIVAGFAVAAFIRPDGHAPIVNREDDLALLAGGRARLGETVLARMLAAGQARVEKTKVHLASARGNTTGLERDVLALESPASFGKVTGVLGEGAGRIERDLVGRGLLMERGEARRVGLFAALPLVLLFALGAVRYQAGVAAERPVGILTVFLIVTVIAILFRVFAVDRRTKGGLTVLRETRARSARLKQAPTQAETGTAVALFGTTVLVGSAYADLHRMRAAGSSADGSSDGGGDGGGGGGCGGGGCGGGG